MSQDAMLLGNLERVRKDLLDLTARNRLLNTSRSRTRSTRLEIVGESSTDVFEQLVTGGKGMTFGAIPDKSKDPDCEPEDETLSLFQPEEDEDEAEIVGTYGDSVLQTPHASEHLQRKLLKLYYDARTYEEEQGVSILYLALGFLKWYEDDNSNVERFAPLLLIPVRLDRQSATSKFRLRFTDEDVTTNLSLQARLKNDFGITLPDVPDIEGLQPTDYFRQIAEAAQTKPRWQILPNDIVLWFFSFSKFLMYRDLQPETWPKGQELEGRGMIQGLLKTGFGSDLPLCDDEGKIDDLIHPVDMVHVVDADSSQAVVIEEAKRGRNLVIQGPPGTGKSQTITNFISGAVRAGKTVLFVAEKMAALDVVHNRLQRVDLGDMCLELHSSKANKRAVLENLKHTLELGAPRVGSVQQVCGELATCRDQLNSHLRVLHTPTQPSGLTPYQLVGELVRLRALEIQPPSFEFSNSRVWTHEEFRRRLAALGELVKHITEFGEPKAHPWRGVALETVLPMDAVRIQSKLPGIVARIEVIQRIGQNLADKLHVSHPTDAVSLSNVARLAKCFAAAPSLDRRSLVSAVWSERRDEIDQIVEFGRRLAECRGRLAGFVCEAAWEAPVGAVRRDLAAYGRSWFRFLVPAYRNAQARLRGLLVGAPPQKLEGRLSIVDDLLTAQKSMRHFAQPATEELGRTAFGSLWRGAESDWEKLGPICDWEKQCRDAKIDANFRAIFAALESVPALQDDLKPLAAELKPALEETKQLIETLKLDLTEAFGRSELYGLPFAELLSRLRLWNEKPEALSSWTVYYSRMRQLSQDGFHEVVDRVHRGVTSAAHAVAEAEAAHYETLIRELWQNKPDLAAFHGRSHERVLEQFKALDKSRVELAKQEVAKVHFDRIPRATGNLGGLGVIRHEIAKKRSHKPIRRLLAEAGPAVQAIKPVFLMSPISVAQYLKPGVLEFDLLVIDEASQVQPVDALGAAARAKQIVVVGDSKQLPPSRFFSRMLGDEEVSEEMVDEVNAGAMESILALCCAQGVPQRMLHWHYRSNHHSLIAVSNREFYENRLHVFPSPGGCGPDQGLSFQHVPNGVFDRGASATNRVEARIVAEAVMEHARHRADQTLGVGCFSVAQRDAILDELELLRREDPSLEHFFMPSDEPFFIKNLENIQGDERDVIFISIGYARDEAGYMAMTFGPLAVDGGERRLNVLITRARDCCRVFSSIRADDIDLNRARSRGAQALKTFLKYAESGLLDTGTATAKEHDSEFERQVALAVSRIGYQTEPQVGVAGFFIDLAVVDPKTPGRFALGIECDGANYHRSRSARDRDRLRSAVLESRGWIIHRIWSTDWFQRPEEELRKVKVAIEAATQTWSGRDAGVQQPQSPDAETEVEIIRDKNNPISNGSISAQPYIVASFKVRTTSEIHDVPASELARVVTRIVEVEGPIHEEEIARRVTQLWGVSRAGSRIKDAVGQAITVASRTSGLSAEGSFFDLQMRGEQLIRNRADVPVATIRKPEMLPPAEIRKAVLAIVQAQVGVSADEVVTEAARLFGFRTTSKPLRERVESIIANQVADGTLELRMEKLFATTC